MALLGEDGYDARGNRTSETYTSQGTSETTLYGYDAADRLTGVQYMERAVVYQLAKDGTRLDLPYDRNLWEGPPEEPQDAIVAPVEAADFGIDPLNYLDTR